MRLRSNLIAVGFAALVSAGIALAQPVSGGSPTLWGPTYRDSSIRRMQVDGVHLGMSRDAVESTLRLRGLQRRSGNFFVRADDHIWIDYAEARGREVVVQIAYSRRLPLEDIGSQRQYLSELFGEPTASRSSGRISSFTYAPGPLDPEYVETVSACYRNWPCQTKLYDVDCRPLVQQNRHPIAAAQVMVGWLSVSITDFGAYALALVRDRHFMERNLNNRECVVPSIH